MLDNGIHAITLAWFLAGFDYLPKRVKALAPDGVSARIKNRFLDGRIKEMNVEDYANFVVEFECPLTGHWVNAYLEASWSFGDVGAFKVVGSRGEIRMDGEKIVVVDQAGNARVRDIFHPGCLNLQAPPGYAGHPQQLRAMIRLVKENAQPLCDVRVGSESLAIAQAVYLSEARGKKAVTVSEFKEYAKKFNKNPEGLQLELLKTGVRGI